MLVGIIARYLESHRRLIVPQMGAFIVKEPGRGVLFSELLKRDDGVLRGLLTEAGASELEAAGEIDRFVFEVRHAVQEGREYPLAGLGAMKPGPNGTISFVYAPQQAAPAETVPPQTFPAGHVAPVENIPPQTAAPAAPVEKAPQTAPAESAPRAEVVAEVGFDEPAAGNAPSNRQVDKFSEAVRTLYNEPASAGNTRDTAPAASDATAAPAKPAADRPSQPVSAQPRSSQPESGPKFETEIEARPQFSLPHPKRSKRDDFSDSYYGRLPRRPAIDSTVRVKKRSDHFIWIALIAALIALAAIAFGHWTDRLGRGGDDLLPDSPASGEYMPSGF